jgi:hypothetical protein
MLGATPVAHDRVRLPRNSMRSGASDHTGTPVGARVPQTLHQVAVDQRRAPNGLPFSCRKRTATTCQKPNDLVRAAVGWNGGLGATPVVHSGLRVARK